MPFSSSRLRFRRAVLLQIALLTTSVAALAHRLPECTSTLRVNTDDALLEIEHRLHRHDGLRLLATQETLPETANLESLELRARLALLVERGFRIRDDSTPQLPELELQLIGAEVDGDYVYVYQQLPLPLPDDLALEHKVLNALPGQLSVEVYVEQGTSRRRIPITRDSDWTALPVQFLVGSLSSDR